MSLSSSLDLSSALLPSKELVKKQKQLPSFPPSSRTVSLNNLTDSGLNQCVDFYSNRSQMQRSQSMLNVRNGSVNGGQENNDLNPNNNPSNDPHGFFDDLKHVQDKIAAILSMLKISAILSALVNACTIGANLDFAKIITSWTPYAQFLAPYLIPVTLIGIIADSFVSLLCFNQQNDSLWSIPQHMMILLGASAALATSFLLPAIAPFIMAGVLGFISLAYFAKALKNVANNEMTQAIKNILFGVGLACTTGAFAAAFIFSAPAWVSIVFPVIAVTSIVLALSITIAKLGRRFFGKKEVEVIPFRQSESISEANQGSRKEELVDKKQQEDFDKGMMCLTLNQLNKVKLKLSMNGFIDLVAKPIYKKTLYNEQLEPSIKECLIYGNPIIVRACFSDIDQKTKYFEVKTISEFFHDNFKNPSGWDTPLYQDPENVFIVLSTMLWKDAGFFSTEDGYMKHCNNDMAQWKRVPQEEVQLVDDFFFLACEGEDDDKKIKEIKERFSEIVAYSEHCSRLKVLLGISNNILDQRDGHLLQSQSSARFFTRTNNITLLDSNHPHSPIPLPYP